MASVTARKNKAGEIISYQIKVTRGRDKLTGKQLTPYTMTYTPPEGWSKKAIERDLQKKMGEFEAACKRGEVLTKEEQKAQATEKAEQIKRQQVEEERKPTFNKYVEIFLQEKSATLSAMTVQGYKQSLKRPAEVFGEMKLEDIDYLMVKKYITDLQTGKRKGKSKKPLAHGTVVSYYTVLHTLFQSAVENDVIPINPMQRMKKPKPRKDDKTKEQKALSISEVNYIIECADKEPLKWRAMIRFMIDSGCRRGEVAGLKWEHIDLKTGKAIICQNAQYTKEKGVYITTPKSHESRDIIISSPVLQILKEWKRQQTLLYFGQGKSTNGYCFTQNEGEIMNPNTITGYIRDFGKRYNIPGLHPHTFRHTMATNSIALGIDVVTVSKKLGHCNPSVTLNIYSHANEDAQRKATEIFAEALYKQA